MKRIQMTDLTKKIISPVTLHQKFGQEDSKLSRIQFPVINENHSFKDIKSSSTTLNTFLKEKGCRSSAVNYNVGKLFDRLYLN